MSAARLIALAGEAPRKVLGSGEARIHAIAALEEATEGTATFARGRGPAAARRIAASPASLIAAETAVEPHDEQCVVVVPDACRWFAAVLDVLFPSPPGDGVHATAYVEAGAMVAADVEIGPFARVEEDVEIGAGSRIGGHCDILAGSRIGPDCAVGPHSVIGSIGQSQYRAEDGTFYELRSLGRAVLEESVAIGAHTTVVRGVLCDTVVRAHATIGNYVNVGRNCVVGARCQIYVGAILCGSAVLESDVVVAAGASINNGVTVGRGSRVGQASVVTKHVPAGLRVFGNPARAYGSPRSQ